MRQKYKMMFCRIGSSRMDASYTVEASWVMVISLSCIFGGILIAIQVCGDCLKQIQSVMGQVSDIAGADAVDQFRKYELVGRLTGPDK